MKKPKTKEILIRLNTAGLIDYKKELEVEMQELVQLMQQISVTYNFILESLEKNYDDYELSLIELQDYVENGPDIDDDDLTGGDKWLN